MVDRDEFLCIVSPVEISPIRRIPSLPRLWGVMYQRKEKRAG